MVETQPLGRDWVLRRFSNPRRIPYVPSPMDVVKRMLEVAEVKPSEVVYDLGCGDGRIPIMASRLFDAKAVGVEIQSILAEKALERVRNLELQDRIKIVNDNLFNVSLREADVVALYLTKEALGYLRPKLETELKPTARVVTHDFRIPGWRSIYVEKIGNHRIYLYSRRNPHAED